MGKCKGCVGRGTGTRCCICGKVIPTALRRTPKTPSELRRKPKR